MFDGLRLEPWEVPIFEAAAATWSTIEGLESLVDELGGEAPISLTRELRNQRLALRTLLAGISWPESTDAAEGQEWGRAMARRRWKGRG
jgi:hypothetical protein